MPASPNAKLRSSVLRAAQSAHLCFPVDGILNELDVQLGTAIGTTTLRAFTLSTSQRFYNDLDKHVPGDESQLQYDSLGIYKDIGNYRLAALRAESVKAA